MSAIFRGLYRIEQMEKLQVNSYRQFYNLCLINKIMVEISILNTWYLFFKYFQSFLPFFYTLLYESAIQNSKQYFSVSIHIVKKYVFKIYLTLNILHILFIYLHILPCIKLYCIWITCNERELILYSLFWSMEVFTET